MWLSIWFSVRLSGWTWLIDCWVHWAVEVS
jgi:hypothetical protein